MKIVRGHIYIEKFSLSTTGMTQHSAAFQFLQQLVATRVPAQSMIKKLKEAFDYMYSI